MDLTDKPDLRRLSAILGDMERGAPGADFLVVGAMARDLLLHYGHGVPIARATRDIDLGVAVAGWEDVDNSTEPTRVLNLVEQILQAEVDRNGNLRLVGEMGNQAERALRLLAGFRNGKCDAQDQHKNG